MPVKSPTKGINTRVPSNLLEDEEKRSLQSGKNIRAMDGALQGAPGVAKIDAIQNSEGNPLTIQGTPLLVHNGNITSDSGFNVTQVPTLGTTTHLYSVSSIVSAPPQVFAGEDRIIVGTNLFYASPTVSDPNDLPLTYQWTVYSQPANTDVFIARLTTLTPTFSVHKPNAAANGQYIFRLTVTNSVGLSAFDDIRVSFTSVEPIYYAPHIPIVEDFVYVDCGETVQVEVEPEFYQYADANGTYGQLGRLVRYLESAYQIQSLDDDNLITVLRVCQLDPGRDDLPDPDDEDVPGEFAPEPGITIPEGATGVGYPGANPGGGGSGGSGGGGGGLPGGGGENLDDPTEEEPAEEEGAEVPVAKPPPLLPELDAFKNLAPIDPAPGGVVYEATERLLTATMRADVGSPTPAVYRNPANPSNNYLVVSISTTLFGYKWAGSITQYLNGSALNSLTLETLPWWWANYGGSTSNFYGQLGGQSVVIGPPNKNDGADMLAATGYTFTPPGGVPSTISYGAADGGTVNFLGVSTSGNATVFGAPFSYNIQEGSLVMIQQYGDFNTITYSIGTDGVLSGPSLGIPLLPSGTFNNRTLALFAPPTSGFVPSRVTFSSYAGAASTYTGGATPPTTILVGSTVFSLDVASLIGPNDTWTVNGAQGPSKGSVFEEEVGGGLSLDDTSDGDTFSLTVGPYNSTLALDIARSGLPISPEKILPKDEADGTLNVGFSTSVTIVPANQLSITAGSAFAGDNVGTYTAEFSVVNLSGQVITGSRTFTIGGGIAGGIAEVNSAASNANGFILLAPADYDAATEPVDILTGQKFHFRAGELGTQFISTKGNPQTVSVVGGELPSGLQVIAESGLIYGTPSIPDPTRPEAQTGFTASIQATKTGVDPSPIRTITVYVDAVVPALNKVVPGDSSVNRYTETVGTAHQIQLQANPEKGGSVRRYRLKAGAPEGVSINTTTGLITLASNMPAQGSDFTVYADNGAGRSEEMQIYIQLENPVP